MGRWSHAGSGRGKDQRRWSQDRRRQSQDKRLGKVGDTIGVRAGCGPESLPEPGYSSGHDSFPCPTPHGGVVMLRGHPVRLDRGCGASQGAQSGTSVPTRQTVQQAGYFLTTQAACSRPQDSAWCRGNWVTWAVSTAPTPPNATLESSLV